MTRCVLRLHLHLRTPHRISWPRLRGLVTALVAASALLAVAGCGGSTTGPQGKSGPPALPHTDARLSLITTGAVSEFHLPVPDPKMYTVLPASLTTGPDGALWFTEILASRIARLTPSGVLTQFTLPPAPTRSQFTPVPGSMTLGPDKALWFTILENPGPNRIGRLTASGALTEFALPAAFRGPQLITTGPDGALWVSDSTSRIGRLTLTGTFTEFDIPRDHAAGIYGLVAGSDGAVWFTSNREIGRITPAGTFTWFKVGVGRSATAGITLGPDGNLWFVESLPDGIGRLSPTGSLTEFALPSSNLPYGSRPTAITAGRDGNVWFTERYASRIGRITPTGQVTEFPLPLPPREQPGFDDAVSIAVGPDGAIWFIQQQANELGRLSP